MNHFPDHLQITCLITSLIIILITLLITNLPIMTFLVNLPKITPLITSL